MPVPPDHDGNVVAIPQPRRRIASARSVVAAIALVASSAAIVPQSVSASTISSQTLDVTQAPYKADATCKKDARGPLAAAFADAQVGTGKQVYFPPGHYCIKSAGSLAALSVNRKVPITVNGAGRDRVTISEQVRGQDLMSVYPDGVTVQNITLDAQSCNCGQGHGFQSGANNTLLQHARVLGGTTTARFPIYFSGGRQTRGYATGNKVIDVILNDQICDDSLSWSYQHNGLIQNVQETGAHLSLFIDQNVRVDGYTYTPGVQARTCPGRTNGFGITAPSSGIVINNFKTYGGGGIIRPQKSAKDIVTNVTITNEQIMNKDFGLEVMDVSGLTIDGGNWGTNGWIRFRPTVTADAVTIKNVASLPMVRFILSRGGKATVGRSAGVHFLNDVFPGFTPMSSQTPYTFQNAFGGSVTFDVNGKSWSKPPGGAFFSGNKQGSNTKCSVRNLSGYIGPISPC